MIRRVLLTAALVGASVLVVPGSPAQARACRIDHECVTTYYADSGRTTVVGERYESCSGTVYTWGVRSGYPTFVESPC
ncbi:DUF6289 family protein [Micromonospora carbonacea]|uniref:DUF6289 family protein n=1 Tax=Micromonospora carbonacea TaxID=47853 RepID=UPI003714C02A